MELRQIVREFDKRIEEVKLSPNAILFLYRSYFSKEDDRDVLPLSDLDKNKFLCLNLYDFKEGKIKKAGEEFIEDFLQGKPIKERGSQDQIVKLDIYPPLIPVLESLSEVVDDGISSEKVNEILKLEPLIAFFDTWICLFPPTNADHKPKWEALFQVPYNNVSLRRRDESYIKKFKAISMKKGIDLGMFIMATFIFIKEHIHDGKAYIPKPARLLDDWEPWYDAAQSLIDGKTTEEIYQIILSKAKPSVQAQPTNQGFHMMS